MQVSTTRALICPETVHQRPCMTRKLCSELSMSVLCENICDCHISVKCAYCIFFSTEIGISTAVLIFFVFLLPISIRFRYLEHLAANRMALSMCLDPCGTRWSSWFQAILYHISAAYLAFMWSTYFFKMPHEADVRSEYWMLLVCREGSVRARGWRRAQRHSACHHWWLSRRCCLRSSVTQAASQHHTTQPPDTAGQCHLLGHYSQTKPKPLGDFSFMLRHTHTPV